MINVVLIETDDYSVEGFNFKINGSSVTVSSGTFNVIKKWYNNISKSISEFTYRTMYPEFRFDLVSDPDFEVMYSVHLSEVDNPEDCPIVVNRLIMYPGAFNEYTDDSKLKYTLTTFTLKPGDEIAIPIINVQKAVMVDVDQCE